MRIAVFVVLSALLSAGAWAQQPAGTGRTVLIVIDDLHLDFRLTPRMREFLKRFAADAFRDGDLVGIVSTGHSSISERYTSDPRVLQSAIDRMTGGGLRPDELVGPTALPQRDVEMRRRIYAFWPRGLVNVSLLQDSDTDEWRRYLRDTQDSLRTLANATSGLLVVDAAGLEAALSAIR